MELDNTEPVHPHRLSPDSPDTSKTTDNSDVTKEVEQQLQLEEMEDCGAETDTVIVTSNLSATTVALSEAENTSISNISIEIKDGDNIGGDKEEQQKDTQTVEESRKEDDVETTSKDSVEAIGMEEDNIEDVIETESADPAQVDEDGNKVTAEATEEISASYYYWKYELSSQSSPKHLTGTREEEFYSSEKGKKSAKFMKGCKWAPDGSCLISCSDDDNLRIFNFPSCFSSVQDWNSDNCFPEESTEEWSSALKIKEGGLIYDYCWYPLMSSMDPVSSCFISSSSEAPIHLWDAFTGTLRASYQPFNHLEQLVAARSIAFDPTGQTIYSGFEKCIRIFNITRPGKECIERPLKQPNAELNQYGIVASICVNPTLTSFYAAGSFDKTIGLYYEDGSIICILQGHAGGITHMKFSSDGMKLFTGGRNDSKIICWDMRQMGSTYKIFDRVVNTHQRIYFDMTPNDRYLVTGGTDGTVRIYEIEGDETEPCCTFKANSDCVNGISCNPYIPILATTSGQRHFFEIANDSDDDEMFVKSVSSRERSCDIKLWKMT